MLKEQFDRIIKEAQTIALTVEEKKAIRLYLEQYIRENPVKNMPLPES